MPICDHCQQNETNLIAVAGHAVCGKCIEALSAQAPVKRRLTRKREGKQLSGICAGIADYTEVDADAVRVGVILLTLFTGIVPGLIGYIVLTFVLKISD